MFCSVLAFTAFLAATPIKLASSPSLSPDGKTLAFAWRGDIWLGPTAGGTARQLTISVANERSPCFSPNGREIAFVSDREGPPQLFVMPIEGGVPRQLTFHSSGFGLEGWFPDGVSLLASGIRDHHWAQPIRLMKIAVDKRAAERVLFDDYGREGAVASDGKRVLFVREGPAWWRKGYRGSQAAQIWLYDADAQSFEKLLDHEAGCRSPIWRPDGKAFYYCGAQSGAFNLREFRLEDKSDRQITHFDDDSVITPTISKDGSTIVFRRLFDFYRLVPGGNETPSKIELSAAGDIETPRIERKVLQAAARAAFTKDGLQTAFVSGGDLWVMDTELREPKQITNTPQEEREPVFSPDGGSVLFVSDMHGQTDLYLAKRKDAQKYWWQNDEFVLERLTNDDVAEESPTFSPDGKTIAFSKSLGDLWLMDADGKNPRRIVESWNSVRYDWSPDGKWIVYAQSDNDFNREIWLTRVDGSMKPFNLSRNPDNDDAPAWSPDGRLIAFVGSRQRRESDIFYVFLRKEDDDRGERERTLERALEKMKKGPSATPKAANPGAAPQTPAAKTPGGGPRRRRPDDAITQSPPSEPKASKTEKADAPAEKKAASAGAARKPVEVTIDFERIHERIRRISIPNSFESNLLWSPDSRKLAFAATVNGNRGTYTVEIPGNLRPQLVSPTVVASGRWLEAGNQVVGIVGAAAEPDPNSPNPNPPASFDDPWTNAGEQIGLEAIQTATRGVPGSMSMSGGAVSSYSFRAYQSVDVAKRFRALFDACWRTMRDVWYDENLNNRDWNAIREKYAPMAELTADSDAVSTLVQMMLGELNGSHLGFTLIGGGASPRAVAGWTAVTPHLGVRFDPAFKGPGLRIRDVIPDGPADKTGAKLYPGEAILEIDGSPVNPEMDLTEVVNGPMGRELRLKIAATDGKVRMVELRPVPFAAVNRLLYEKWIKDTRAKVEELSGGALGYLHVRAMSNPEFQRFGDELFSVGEGKKGLVIDVRENGGGSTADHLLTALCQPRHAVTVPRGGGQGYPQDRVIYTVWNRPIVVLCNQNSFSNAEIFSHAIKTLGRGKLVGVPTAGGVISTGARTIMEAGRLRIPFRGWFGIADGEDMELNGAKPDVVLWPAPGEMPAGKDVQLEAAVKLLLEEVRKADAAPARKLIKASERKR